MHRAKATTAVLLMVGLCALCGSWVADQSRLAAQAAPVPMEAKSKIEPAKADNLAVSIRAKLAKPVNLDAIDPNTPLKDALEFITSKFEITFVINTEAFRQDSQIQDPESAPVRLPKMKGVRLETVLKLLVAQTQGAYLLRADHIEITTPNRQIAEVWGQFADLQDQPVLPGGGGFGGLGGGGFGMIGAGLQPFGFAFPKADDPPTRRRPLLKLVHNTFDNKPLEEAVRELSESSGTTIVLDARRAGDKARVAVSASFTNVPLDTAVRILANQAELKAILLDNVLYLTTEENAKKMQADQDKLNRFGLEAPTGSPPPGA